jgi:hypothetical protein
MPSRRCNAGNLVAQNAARFFCMPHGSSCNIRNIMHNEIMNMQTFKTFKQVRAAFNIEKWFHMPHHFFQSGQYVCHLHGNKECYKAPFADEYIVRNRR